MNILNIILISFFLILSISCTRNLTNKDVQLIENYFSDEEKRISRLTSVNELLRAQVGFNQNTLVLFYKTINMDLAEAEREKVFMIFKTQQSNVNHMITSKIDSELTMMR